MTKKEDLSQITIGQPKSNELETDLNDESLFAQTPDTGKSIEGFTGLITPEPMPTGEEPIALDESTPDDPLASLPPIDQEILTTATGGNTDRLPEEEDEVRPSPLAPEATTDLSPAVQAIEAGLDEIKKFSDHVAPTAIHVPAAIPYSLLIEGRLQTHEKERLTAIVTKELGIREVELEPQFEAGKILIPRISEYAGVLLIQALRGAHVKMKLGPSDLIFTSKDPITEDELIHPHAPDFFNSNENDHFAADQIPITSESKLPNQNLKTHLMAIDTIHASMNIKATWVQSINPSYFQDALDALKRQLKFKAHHKGATAILNFQTQLIPISDQTQYKLIVQGTAVK
jgi:hypothetical protein